MQVHAVTYGGLRIDAWVSSRTLGTYLGFDGRIRVYRYGYACLCGPAPGCMGMLVGAWIDSPTPA